MSKAWVVENSISLFAVLVSLISLGVTARLAHFERQQLDRHHQADVAIEMLEKVYSEKLVRLGDDEDDFPVCILTKSLALAEKDLRENEEPFLVIELVQNIHSARLWSPRCALFLEQLLNEGEANFTNGDDKLGEWHAIAASFKPSPKGCVSAQDALDEMKDKLEEIYSDVSIRVVRTNASDVYAVAIDAGNDRSLAVQFSEAVKGVARPGEMGHDSYPQINDGWTVVSSCPP